MKARSYAAPAVRRVALLSDSHGVVADAILQGIVGADLIVHAGDIGSMEVLRQLQQVAPLRSVRGNNDTLEQWPPGSDATLERLPEALEIRLAGGVLLVVHGHQWPAVKNRHARLRAAFPHVRCIVYGHSHRRVLDCDTTPWVVNPGACGRARTYGGASWLGLSVRGTAWRLSVSAFS